VLLPRPLVRRPIIRKFNRMNLRRSGLVAALGLMLGLMFPGCASVRDGPAESNPVPAAAPANPFGRRLGPDWPPCALWDCQELEFPLRVALCKHSAAD
jgi:hypothetical protein